MPEAPRQYSVLTITQRPPRAIGARTTVAGALSTVRQVLAMLIYSHVGFKTLRASNLVQQPF